MPVFRAAPLLAVLLAVVLRGAGAADAPALPACATADIETIDGLDSGLATAGDHFRFRTAADIAAGKSYPALPKGSVGYGVVMVAHHGASRGHAGFMIIDSRFIGLADGTHVPVEIVPEPSRDTPVLQGKSANAPGYIGFIPFGGIMTGAYNTLHHGHEIVVPPGTRLTVIVGDDLALGACRLPPVSRPQERGTPTPAPHASAG